MKISRSVVTLLLSAALATSANASTLYGDGERSIFEATLSASVTDTYSNPGYAYSQSDAAMSAVLGLTGYQATGHLNVNYVYNGGYYCAGCNGSFLLSFTSPALGGSGTYGVGFDYANVPTLTEDPVGQPYVAFVTFGDNTSAEFNLLSDADYIYPLPHFFGITASQKITSIHLGLPGGATTKNGGFSIDNLTVAVVPEPEAYAMLLAGLGLLGLIARRRKATQ